MNTCVERSAQRSARLVHLEMRRGLGILSAIATTAPLLGVFGTLVGILSSFRGISGNQDTIFVFTTGLLGHAIAPTAFGLLVAIPAWWGWRYCTLRLEDLDSEMQLAIADLADMLNRLDRSRAIT